MPLYDYACKACNHECEVFQRIHEKPKTRCPVCASRRYARKVGPIRVAGVSTADTKDDAFTRQHYGLKKGEQVHRNFMSGEVLKFDRNTSAARKQEAIRQSYIRAGVTEAEDPGAVKIRNK